MVLKGGHASKYTRTQACKPRKVREHNPVFSLVHVVLCRLLKHIKLHKKELTSSASAPKPQKQ